MSTNKRSSSKGAQIHPTENQIQYAVIEHCKIVHKIEAVHCPNELMRYLSDGQKHHFIKLGVKIGFHDVFIFEARGKWHGLSIEIKRDKKSKISPEQLEWVETLIQKGYYAAICIGLDACLDTIENYLDGKL